MSTIRPDGTIGPIQWNDEFLMNQAYKGTEKYKKTVWDYLLGSRGTVIGPDQNKLLRDDLLITSPDRTDLKILIDPSLGAVSHDLQSGKINLNMYWDSVASQYPSRDWRDPVNLPQPPKPAIPAPKEPSNQNNDSPSNSDTIMGWIVIGSVGLITLFVLAK